MAASRARMTPHACAVTPWLGSCIWGLSSCVPKEVAEAATHQALALISKFLHACLKIQGGYSRSIEEAGLRQGASLQRLTWAGE